jgi:hypothetical protein
VLAEGEPTAAQLDGLVSALDWAERVTVTGSALLRRLPGRPDLAARLLRSTLAPPPAPAPADEDADSAHVLEASVPTEPGYQPSVSSRTASMSGSPSAGEAEHAGPGVSVPDAADRALLRALMQRRPVPGAEAARRARGAGARADEGWGRPLQTVRVLECECGGGAAHAGSGGAAATERSSALRHRLFSRVRPGELRLATVVISEPC